MLTQLSDIKRGISIGIFLIITTFITYLFNDGDLVDSSLCLSIGFSLGFYFQYEKKVAPYIFGAILIGTTLSRILVIDESILMSFSKSIVFALISVSYVYTFNRIFKIFKVKYIISIKTIIIYFTTTFILSNIAAVIITIMTYVTVPDIDILRVFVIWGSGYVFGVLVFGTAIIFSYIYEEEVNFTLKRSVFSIILIGSFIVVASALFSNTYEVFNFSNLSYILMVYYLLIAFFFTYKMILLINILYVVIYQYFLINLAGNLDYALIQHSIVVYLLFLSIIASTVMMVILELKNRNAALQESNEKLESLVYSTESLLRLSDDILGTDIKIREDYLKRIFNIACSIFDNYDYATCFIKEKPYVNFIDTVGYDKEVLNNFKFKTNTTDFVDIESPYIVHDGEKSVKTALGNKYEEWKSVTPQISEAIRFGIYIDEDTIAGMSFDILKDSGKSFNLNHLENYKSFQKLMNSFFSINYLNYKNISLKNDIVLSLIRTLELFDHYTGGHSEEVAYLSNEMAKRCGLDEKDSHDIYWAGVVHDIGKVGIDSAIINKPDRLTLEEYELLKQHSMFGYEILNKAEDLKHIAILVKHHHEWWNGEGYPSGLKGDEIPLGAQIISVCDAVSTMAKKRPYTIVKTSTQIVEELKLFSGTQFSPKPASEMIKFIEEGYLDAFYKTR